MERKCCQLLCVGVEIFCFGAVAQGTLHIQSENQLHLTQFGRSTWICCLAGVNLWPCIHMQVHCTLFSWEKIMSVSFLPNTEGKAYFTNSETSSHTTDSWLLCSMQNYWVAAWINPNSISICWKEEQATFQNMASFLIRWWNSTWSERLA